MWSSLKGVGIRSALSLSPVLFLVRDVLVAFPVAVMKCCQKQPSEEETDYFHPLSQIQCLVFHLNPGSHLLSWNTLCEKRSLLCEPHWESQKGQQKQASRVTCWEQQQCQSIVAVTVDKAALEPGAFLTGDSPCWKTRGTFLSISLLFKQSCLYSYAKSTILVIDLKFKN